MVGCLDGLATLTWLDLSLLGEVSKSHRPWNWAPCFSPLTTKDEWPSTNFALGKRREWPLPVFKET
jgi:hypothetical protein